MPQPIGNSDFARDFMIGVNIGNMRAMRQERMLQLRSQEALRAIQERQSVAQAEVLMQHAAVYKQQIQAARDQQESEAAFKLAVGSTFQENLRQSTDPETGEQDVPTAMARTHAALSAIDPKLADN